MSSLDKFLDGDDMTQATEFTTGSQSLLNQSAMMNSVSSMTIEGSCQSIDEHQVQHCNGRDRYRRRGSVTKFTLEHHDDSSVGSSSIQCDALIGASTSFDSTHTDDDDLSHSQHTKGRCRRRGSVTKFSLDEHLNNASGHHDHGDDVSVGCHSVKSEMIGRPPRATRSTKTKRNSGTKKGGLMSLGDHLMRGRKKQHEESDDDASVLSRDCISVQSDIHLLHRHSSHEGLPPRGSGGGRYCRRGSVTKYSLDTDSAHSLKGMEGSSPNKPPLVAQYSDRSVGDSSFAEEGSIHSVPDHPAPSRQRYRRRGSVTKFSLEETAAELGKSSSHSTATSDTFSSFDDDSNLYGYGDSSNGGNSESEAHHPPARKDRYRRRGSVTRYSLEPEEEEEIKRRQSASSGTVPKPPRHPRR